MFLQTEHMEDGKIIEDSFRIKGEKLFKVGYTNLAFFSRRPHRTGGMVSLYCVSGTALVTINLQTHRFVPNSEIVLLPSSFVQLIEGSSDLLFRYLTFE